MGTICYANRDFATIQHEDRLHTVSEDYSSLSLRHCRSSDYVRFEDRAYPVDWNWRVIRVRILQRQVAEFDLIHDCR
jgi:hypothetical protein